MTVPNLISIIRIGIVPFFCTTYFNPETKHIAFALLILSGISDVLDGFIARRFNQVSDLGKVLDPIADKLFTISTITCICLDGIVGPWLLIVIVAKELFLMCGGMVLYKKNQAVIASKWYGKLATVLFFASFVLSFAKAENPTYNVFINILFAVALLMSLFAMVNYVMQAVQINNARKAAERHAKKI